MDLSGAGDTLGGMGKHFQFTDEGVTVTRTGLSRVIYLLGALGVALGVVGLREGYARLGASSEGGHILTVAIVVAALCVSAVFGYAVVSGRRARRGRR